MGLDSPPNRLSRLEQGCGEGGPDSNKKLNEVSWSISHPQSHLPPLFAQTDKDTQETDVRVEGLRETQEGIRDRQEDKGSGPGPAGWLEGGGSDPVGHRQAAEGWGSSPGHAH